MESRTFFFHKDNLLLPSNTPDDLIANGLSLELSKDFSNIDVFEIPALDEPASIIRVVSIPPNDSLPYNWKSIPVRQVIAVGTANPSMTEKIIRACHVSQWRHESRFCGTCGAENADVPRQAQRLCPKCGRTEFPRICPAVIIIITDDENRILLAHNKRFKKGVYSHISGFNEAGETLEQTVVREIKEEVNIKVKEIEYIKSQSWPFPNSLMIGFKAKYKSGEVKPDGDEIEDAKWFKKDNLPELPGEGSLSRYMINNWLSGNL